MSISRNRIYLDYAATTPVDPAVLKAMQPLYSDVFGNPSSVHWFGQQASAAVFDARQIIARALHATYQEIIFTGSATEANNLALRGCVSAALALQDTTLARPVRIIVSAIEHESVLKTAIDWEQQGVKVVCIPVNREGIVDREKLKAALDEKTTLVSIQYANSEIGVIQPISEIGKIIRDFRRSKLYPLFHTDAVQAFQFLKCDVNKLGVDLITLSAHKIYGPKGIGVLYIKNQIPKIKNNGIMPFVTGGGQEFGFRSGTENVPAIVGFAKAVEITERARTAEARRLKGLRDRLWNGILKYVPDAEINGPVSLEVPLPNILNVYFPGRSAQDLCIELDLAGCAVSPGTACSSRAASPSSVIEALGYGGDRPTSSIRFSLGRPTTPEEIKKTLFILKKRFGR